MPTHPTPPAAGASPIANARVYGIFLLSGAAALVYQVIWARWLGLIFGNTTTSVSIILGAFMLGLALGSRVGGAVVGRLANPMRTYALLELGIGAFALAFPLATAGMDRLYTTLASAESPALATIAWRALLAFALLLVPTSLMGATLPLLTEHFRRDPQHDRTWKVGVLYAANTIGAALGVVAASFVGIELIGIRATTIAAAGLNFLVAALGLALSRRALPAVPQAAAAERTPTPLAGRIALLALALSGGLALASEVLWTRTLQILVGNSTYAFATILVVYLLGVALGSAGFSRLVKSARNLAAWMVALLLGMGAWTLLASAGFGVLQDHAFGGARLEFTAGALLVRYLQGAALLLPLALLSGALFPVGTRLLEPQAEDAGGEGVARAYAWNTIGAVGGSLLAGFVVAVWFDYFQAVDLLAAGYALAALAVGAGFVAGGGLRAGAALAGGLAALVLAGYGVAGARGESRFVRWLERTHPNLEVTFHRPGLQGVTTAVRRVGEPLASLLLVNAQGMTAKLTDTKMMAHLPLLVHRDDPRRMLVICFGMGTTFRSALSHAGVEVTAVELVPEVLEAFPQFYADAAQVAANPRGHRIATDGRNFLELTRERFDVITIDPPPPIDAAGVTNLYSREFVALARARLAPGGLFAHWLPFPGTGSGVESVATLRMLLHTIASEFPYVMAIQAVNGVGLHVLASDAPIELDLPAIAARLEDPAVAADLDEWQPVPIEYFSHLEPLDALDFVLQRGPRSMRISGARLEGLPLLTDDRPRLEFDLWRMVRDGQEKVRPGAAWGG